VFRKILPSRYSGPCIAIALSFFGCGGALSEKGLGDEKQAMSDEEFVASIKQQIDDLVTYQDAMGNVEKVRGKMVKWNGDIVITWNDKLLIACPRREGGWNHFILLLDHPLPVESSIEDLIQTVSKGDAVYVVGRIIDLQTIVLETGSDLTIPHLQGYLISKYNDREFANPVWVGHKM
jgi:hypothetical protein